MASRTGRRAATDLEIMARVLTTDKSWNGSACLRWDGLHRNKDGRPVFHKTYVYRIIYKLERGNLPSGKGNILHHHCENKWCVNPYHVEFMKQSIHMKRHGFGGDPGFQKGKTHCPSGHPYDSVNIYIIPSGNHKGERQCKRCNSEKQRVRRSKQYQLKCETEAAMQYLPADMADA